MVEPVAEIFAAALPDEVLEGVEVVVVEMLVEDRVEALGLDEVFEAGNLREIEAVRIALPEPLANHVARLGDMLEGMAAND